MVGKCLLSVHALTLRGRSSDNGRNSESLLATRRFPVTTGRIDNESWYFIPTPIDVCSLQSSLRAFTSKRIVEKMVVPF